MNDDECITPLPSGAFRVRVRYRKEAVSTTAATREAARELRDAIKQRIVDGELSPTKGKSVRELGPRFLSTRADNRSADDDESRWHRHIATTSWARRAPSTVTRADGANWLRELRRKKLTWKATSGGRRAEKLKWQSRKHCLNLARRFFAWAIEQGLLQANPFVGLLVEREDGDEDDGYQDTWYLDIAEQHRFLKTWDTFHDTRRREKPIVQFAIGTGLRESEMWCLHLKDVHVDGDSPHVVVRYGSWDRKRGRYLTPKGRKGSKRVREVPLFGLGLEAAREWCAQLSLYAPKNPLGLMFPSERGARRDRPPRSWGDAVEAFGDVPRIGRAVWWHLLRHTCASSLVSGWWGMRWALEDVSKLLGHKDIRTTQIYAHLAPKVVQDTAARAHAAFKLRGHAEATPPEGVALSLGDHGHARSDSNRRHSASKAGPSATFSEQSARRGLDVASIVHVLRDISTGRYVPDAPIVHGLELALDAALAAAKAKAS